MQKPQQQEGKEDQQQEMGKVQQQQLEQEDNERAAVAFFVAQPSMWLALITAGSIASFAQDAAYSEFCGGVLLMLCELSFMCWVGPLAAWLRMQGLLTAAIHMGLLTACMRRWCCGNWTEDCLAAGYFFVVCCTCQQRVCVSVLAEVVARLSRLTCDRGHRMYWMTSKVEMGPRCVV